jgi:hypothetical protein
VFGHQYVAGTDEHDEDGVLISDVYTDRAENRPISCGKPKIKDTRAPLTSFSAP